MNSQRRLPPLYPFLIAAFPVVHLYANNLGTATPGDIARSLTIVLAATALVLLIAIASLRDHTKAGIVTAVFMAMFCSYGHALRVANRVIGKLAGTDPYPWLTPATTAHWFLYLYGAALVAMVAAVAISRRNLCTPSRFISALGAILVLMPVLRIAVHYVRNDNEEDRNQAWNAVIADARRTMAKTKTADASEKPDIYYIILDAYAGGEALRKTFHYSNDEFVAYLESLGFFVASKSNSNYHGTSWSLSSSLNFDYLDNLARHCKETWQHPPKQAIRNNKVCRILIDRGYRYLTPNSGWSISSVSPYADRSLLPQSKDISELERALIDRSALSIWWPRYLDSYLRKHTMNMFDYLIAVSRIPEPTFAFFHIVCPHEPFVFDAEGNLPRLSVGSESGEEQWARLYRDQVAFVNKRMATVLESILRNSRTPPIIIVQGDHGWAAADFWAKWGNPEKATRLSDEEICAGMAPRVSILNAYYLPGVSTTVLYDRISPVNSFRVVLDKYFGGRFPLLKDESFVPRSGDSSQTTVLTRLQKLEEPDSDPKTHDSLPSACGAKSVR